MGFAGKINNKFGGGQRRIWILSIFQYAGYFNGADRFRICRTAAQTGNESI